MAKKECNCKWSFADLPRNLEEEFINQLNDWD